MNIKTRLIKGKFWTVAIIFFLFLTMGISKSIAGPSSSGGGMAIVCRDSANLILSAELLDYYEARIDTNRTLIQSAGNLVEDHLAIAINVNNLQGMGINPSPPFIEQSLNEFLSAVDWVAAGSLPFLGDQGAIPPIPTGCRLEQLAIFDDNDERVSIDLNLWSHLNSINQAALVFHELYYRTGRKWRESTSEITRTEVKIVLSLTGNTPLRDGIDDPNRSLCVGYFDDGNESHLTDFILHRNYDENGTVVTNFQFTQVAGRPVLVKTAAVFEGFPFDIVTKSENGVYHVYPNANGSVDRSIQVPIKTDHRSDWQIKLKYKTDEPVEFMLIQDGIPIANTILQSC